MNRWMMFSIAVGLACTVACDKKAETPQPQSTGPLPSDPEVEIEAPSYEEDPEASVELLAKITADAEVNLEKVCPDSDFSECRKLDGAAKWAEAAKCYVPDPKKYATNACDVAAGLLAANRLGKAGDEEAATARLLRLRQSASPEQRGVILVSEADRRYESDDRVTSGFYYFAYTSMPDGHHERLTEHVKARCAESTMTCEAPKLHKIQASPTLRGEITNEGIKVPKPTSPATEGQPSP